MKQKLIGSIYPEKLVFENKAYRTKSIHEGITLICKTGKDIKGNKKGLASNFGNQSYGVIWLGLEPRTHTLKVYCSTN